MWERLRKLLGLIHPQTATELSPPTLDVCRQLLSQSGLELEGVKKKLTQRSETMKRLAQRYDEQADKHNKLKHRDLAETAARQKLKDQLELLQWQKRVEELAQRLKLLKARQARLEERGLGFGVDELTGFREAIDCITGEIHQIDMQLELPMELEDGEVSTFQ